MECACISESVDGECEVVVDKKATARKLHHCCECSCEITPGTEYRKETVRDIDRIEQYKTCMDCMSVREHLVCDFFYTRIWDTIADFIDDYSSDMPWAKIGRLTPVARARVCEMIERAWGDDN